MPDFDQCFNRLSWCETAMEVHHLPGNYTVYTALKNKYSANYKRETVIIKGANRYQNVVGQNGVGKGISRLLP